MSSQLIGGWFVGVFPTHGRMFGWCLPNSWEDDWCLPDSWEDGWFFPTHGRIVVVIAVP